MGFDWGKAWGSVTAGTEKALEGAFGVRPEGFYNNRFNPQTRQLEGVRPDGTSFNIPASEMTLEQREKLGADLRNLEARKIRADVIDAQDRGLRNQIAVLRETIAPQLEGIRANAQGQAEQTRLLGKRLDQDAEDNREARRLEWERMGITDRFQQAQLTQQAEVNRENVKYRNAQLAADERNIEYNREQNWRNGLMQGFALLSKGIAASF